MKIKYIFLFALFLTSSLYAEVSLGLDRIFEEPYSYDLKGKKIALVTNQSAINSKKEEAFDLFFKNQKKFGYKLVAAFAPEHGLDGKKHAFDKIEDEEKNKVPIFSLHGNTKRPTFEMLEGIDLIIYDIQSVGVRCYTYETTLSYIIEEAAKKKISVMVLDRPNPRGGTLVEGKNVDEKFKCFFSYNDVPFCHGMTIGELARYLNEEEKIHCVLKVVPMLGWKRSMTYTDTQLPWNAPSPNIPDSETTLVYPATIFIGETLEVVSVDLRGEKPFKRIGAPWIDGSELAGALNQRNLPGVVFTYQKFTPEWGKYENEECEGVLLKVISPETFQPLLTQYTIIEELMRIYPEDFEKNLSLALKKDRKKACNYITGSENLMNCILNKESFTTEIKEIENLFIKDFLGKRAKYLIY